MLNSFAKHLRRNHAVKETSLFIVKNDVAIQQYQRFFLAPVIKPEQHVLNDIDTGYLFIVGSDYCPRCCKMMSAGKHDISSFAVFMPMLLSPFVDKTNFPLL